MRLVRLAEACHPELEELHVVLLGGSQNAQQFLGVFLRSAVHFGELEEDLYFTAKGNKQPPQKETEMKKQLPNTAR